MSIRKRGPKRVIEILNRHVRLRDKGLFRDKLNVRAFGPWNVVTGYEVEGDPFGEIRTVIVLFLGEHEFRSDKRSGKLPVNIHVRFLGTDEFVPFISDDEPKRTRFRCRGNRVPGKSYVPEVNYRYPKG